MNPLVVLNASLTKRNISRAAEKINLSQPATSNALSRLRVYFDDKLLVSFGRQLLFRRRANFFAEQHSSTFNGWFMESSDVKRRIDVMAPTMEALPVLIIGTQ
jgi:DNA-binding transcriptional LysR family regulator